MCYYFVISMLVSWNVILKGPLQILLLLKTPYLESNFANKLLSTIIFQLIKCMELIKLK